MAFLFIKSCKVFLEHFKGVDVMSGSLRRSEQAGDASSHSHAIGELTRLLKGFLVSFGHSDVNVNVKVKINLFY